LQTASLVLKAMNRPWQANPSTGRCSNRTAAQLPRGCSHHLIVGFPGAKREQFEHLLAFVEDRVRAMSACSPFLQKGTAPRSARSGRPCGESSGRNRLMNFSNRSPRLRNASGVGASLNVLIRTGKTQPVAKMLGAAPAFASRGGWGVRVQVGEGPASAPALGRPGAARNHRLRRTKTLKRCWWVSKPWWPISGDAVEGLDPAGHGRPAGDAFLIALVLAPEPLAGIRSTLMPLSTVKKQEGRDQPKAPTRPSIEARPPHGSRQKTHNPS